MIDNALIERAAAGFFAGANDERAAFGDGRVFVNHGIFIKRRGWSIAHRKLVIDFVPRKIERLRHRLEGVGGKEKAESRRQKAESSVFGVHRLFFKLGGENPRRLLNPVRRVCVIGNWVSAQLPRSLWPLL